MSTYLPPDQILNNPEFIPIQIKPDGMGGSRIGQVTHHTRVPSTNPDYLPKFNEDGVNIGWEDVLYFRYIGSNIEERSPRNGLGGYVYVLINKQYPGMCKIGMTTNHPTKRLQQINAAGVVDDWNIAYHYKCARPFDFEQAIHTKLDNIRTRDDREFFDLEANEAIHLINEMGPMFEPMD